MAETCRLTLEHHVGAQDEQLQFAYMVSAMEALPALTAELMEVVIQPRKLPCSLGRGCLLLHCPVGEESHSEPGVSSPGAKHAGGSKELPRVSSSVGGGEEAQRE